MVAVGERDDEVAGLLGHLRGQGTVREAGSPQPRTLLTGMEFCLSTEGEIMVILCRRKLGQSSAQSGNSPEREREGGGDTSTVSYREAGDREWN